MGWRRISLIAIRSRGRDEFSTQATSVISRAFIISPRQLASCQNVGSRVRSAWPDLATSIYLASRNLLNLFLLVYFPGARLKMNSSQQPILFSKPFRTVSVLFCWGHWRRKFELYRL